MEEVNELHKDIKDAICKHYDINPSKIFITSVSFEHVKDVPILLTPENPQHEKMRETLGDDAVTRIFDSGKGQINLSISYAKLDL